MISKKQVSCFFCGCFLQYFTGSKYFLYGFLLHNIKHNKTSTFQHMLKRKTQKGWKNLFNQNERGQFALSFFTLSFYGHTFSFFSFLFFFLYVQSNLIFHNFTFIFGENIVVVNYVICYTMYMLFSYVYVPLQTIIHGFVISFSFRPFLSRRFIELLFWQ